MTQQTDDKSVFGERIERCELSGRPFETGRGSLPREQQTAMFVQEAEYLADRPKDGEICPQTGREFYCAIGAPSKTIQTKKFLDELSPAQKAQRQAAFEALRDAVPAGKA
jgi:hypothetical protein